MKKQVLYWLTLIFITTNSHAQQWNSMGPHFGGYFRDFAFHPDNPSIIFAGGDDSAGIWVSNDGGETWSLASTDLPNMSSWHIEIDKGNPNLMFACDLYNRYGVGKSTDGGEHWTASAIGLNTIGARTVSKLAIFNADTLFISTGLSAADRYGDGIYKSFDGGITWNETGLQGLTCPAIIITPESRLIAASFGQGLYYSDDLGENWSTHPDIPETAVIDQIEVKDSIVVLTAGTDGIFVSSNNGISFTGSDPTYMAYDLAIGNISPVLEIYSSLLVRYTFDYDTGEFTASSIEDIGFLDNTVYTMGIGARGDTIIVGQLVSGKFFLSEDKGESWSNPTISPAANNINDLAIDPNNSAHLFASLVVTNTLGADKKCLLESTDGGINWDRKGPDASGYKIKFHPTNSDILLCGTFTDGLFKSTDGGDSWVNLRPISWINDILYHPDYPNEILISEVDNILDPTAVNILKSTDGGESFTSVFSGLNLITQIIHIPDSDSSVAATKWNGLYLSTDRGDTWEPWTLAGDSIKTIAYHNGAIYAGSESGELYKTNDTDIENISGPWDEYSEITNIYFKNDSLYIGTNGAEHDRDSSFSNHGGIWYTTNDGADWTDLSAGLSCTQFFGNNVFVEHNGKLLVGTYGGSLFRLNPISLGLEEKVLPGAYVYPNPFQNTLTLTCPNMTLGERLNCKVFNLNGQLVFQTTFTNMPQNQLDLKQLEKGIYQLKITDKNGSVLTQKIIKQ